MFGFREILRQEEDELSGGGGSRSLGGINQYYKNIREGKDPGTGLQRDRQVEPLDPDDFVPPSEVEAAARRRETPASRKRRGVNSGNEPTGSQDQPATSRKKARVPSQKATVTRIVRDHAPVEVKQRQQAAFEELKQKFLIPRLALHAETYGKAQEVQEIYANVTDDTILQVTEELESTFLNADLQAKNIADAIEDTRANRINPGQFFTNVGDAGTFASAIAVGVGHLASALGGGPNTAFAVIQGAIDRNMRAQLANLNTDRFLVNAELNFHNNLIRQGMNEISARQTVLAMHHQMASTQIQALMSRTRSEETRLQMETLDLQHEMDSANAQAKAIESNSTQVSVSVDNINDAQKASVALAKAGQVAQAAHGGAGLPIEQGRQVAGQLLNEGVRAGGSPAQAGKTKREQRNSEPLSTAVSADEAAAIKTGVGTKVFNRLLAVANQWNQTEEGRILQDEKSRQGLGLREKERYIDLIAEVAGKIGDELERTPGFGKGGKTLTTRELDVLRRELGDFGGALDKKVFDSTVTAHKGGGAEKLRFAGESLAFVWRPDLRGPENEKARKTAKVQMEAGLEVERGMEQVMALYVELDGSLAATATRVGRAIKDLKEEHLSAADRGTMGVIEQIHSTLIHKRLQQLQPQSRNAADRKGEIELMKKSMGSQGQFQKFLSWYLEDRTLDVATELGQGLDRLRLENNTVLKSHVFLGDDLVTGDLSITPQDVKNEQRAREIQAAQDKAKMLGDAEDLRQ